jgi:hypothetical protein
MWETSVDLVKNVAGVPLVGLNAIKEERPEATWSLTRSFLTTTEVLHHSPHILISYPYPSPIMVN